MVVRANRKRVFYLDLLKFVSIYAMIVCHLFYNYYSYTHESARGMIPGLMSMEKTLYLIVPGIFIFCLGGGLYLCRTKTWNYFVHRGFSLLAIGLILNVFRWLIPYWITRNPGPAEGFPDVVFYLLFNSDILFFAGLFFLLYGMLARLTDRLWIRFGMLALLNIAGVFIPPVETASPAGMLSSAISFMYRKFPSFSFSSGAFFPRPATALSKQSETLPAKHVLFC